MCEYCNSTCSDAMLLRLHTLLYSVCVELQIINLCTDGFPISSEASASDMLLQCELMPSLTCDSGVFLTQEMQKSHLGIAIYQLGRCILEASIPVSPFTL